MADAKQPSVSQLAALTAFFEANPEEAAKVLKRAEASQAEKRFGDLLGEFKLALEKPVGEFKSEPVWFAFSGATIALPGTVSVENLQALNECLMIVGDIQGRLPIHDDPSRHWYVEVSRDDGAATFQASIKSKAIDAEFKHIKTRAPGTGTRHMNDYYWKNRNGSVVKLGETQIAAVEALRLDRSGGKGGAEKSPQTVLKGLPIFDVKANTLPTQPIADTVDWDGVELAKGVTLLAA